MILATICCRGGSKGVPEKNIKLLDGIPLIVHSIRQSQGCSLIQDLIISTDDDRIAQIASEAGAKVPFKRPADLASDTSSKWPVFIHALEFYEKEYGVQVDYLVDLDVTVPLKSPQDIDGAIQLALDHPETEVIITGYEPERNPYFNMMEVRQDGLAEIVKKSETPIVRRQDAPQVYSLSPAAFVIKKSALYNYPHWSKAPCRIYPMPRERAIDIDSNLDFELIEFLMHKKNE
ncbi:acylneuraminate cytidylyltransferase family protein [Algoriphagus boritolerans]|uniref:N-acylneuraminate cytidylyltransferase n=1 Tax=Algoriphagus boritolerans DSM 17298 = JCM 18970 TaxID=1120964 RepID=A0A1H5RWP7_9BACT|nr:acylneuraminate cytidylyltransferase family protein [Algoriphagus boritolerans]SEF42037.1 N-acylneuraminate cytidylyltransferase [Algoriphagus boritolerans DSM 17298 = JCM 18970]